jgi:hypothetical protein
MPGARALGTIPDAYGVSSATDTSTVEPSPLAAAAPGVARSARRRWLVRAHRGDLIAIAILTVLPALVFGIPALLGHPVMPGDDLTQNYPLRVLAGRQVASGQLPLLDPYIWSGSPLLADWNAGAAYPLTLLFAVLPGVTAWTVNLVVTWAVAGVGMFCFLRALRLTTLASFLGALSFAFAGAMSAQVGHLGLVAGMSFVPLELLAVLRLAQPRSLSSRLRWISVMAAAFGLTILAGEPRAIDDAGVLVILYALWQLMRAGRRSGPLAVSLVAGLGLGVCVGAIQLLPGLAAISTSQRAASSFALFSSGSLTPRWLLLMLVPDLLGGSGSFGQPAFFAHYQLAEVTGYVGIVPLVAAVALLARLRLRRPPPEWLVWHIIALVGIVFALGGTTPVGHILADLPLVGSQRLQSRNILISDTALAVLLAYWADDPLGAASRAARWRAARRPRRWWTDPATVLGVLPPIAVLAVVALGIWWTGGLLGWLTVSGSAARAAGSLAGSVAPFGVLAAAAIALVLVIRHISPRWRNRLIAGFVVTDVVVFTLLAVVAVLPSTAHAAAAATASKDSAPQRAGSKSARPVAELGYRGRFAIYDPGLRSGAQLPKLAAPDLNVIGSMPSAQGYSSIVDGRYATATGSHRATGNGQDVLSTRAIADGVLGELNTSVLLTLPSYLIQPVTHPDPPSAASRASSRRIRPHQRGTWYLGTALRVSEVTIADSDAVKDAAGGFQIGLTTQDGQTHWFRAVAVSAGSLAVRLTSPATAVAVTGQAGSLAAAAGPPTLTEANGRKVIADGVLQRALTPPQWGFANFDGSFAIFVDHDTAGALTVTSLTGRPATKASVRVVSGAADEPSAVAVQSTAGVRITRAVADIPGWTATWHPATGPAEKLVVRRAGVVQVVAVPAGKGVLTWTYLPPRVVAGLVLSLASVVAIAAMATSRRWLWFARES